MSEKELLILKAAESAFISFGFKETSIREIAKLAGVNSAMLNYYFTSKEKLLERVIEEKIKRFVHVGKRIPAFEKSTGEKLRSIFKWHVRLIGSNPDFFRFILREHLISSSRAATELIDGYLKQTILLIRTTLNEGVDHGTFKQMDVETASLAIQGIYINCMLNGNFLSGNCSMPDLSRRVLAFLKAFILTLMVENEPE